MTSHFARASASHLLTIAALGLGGCAGHSDFMAKVLQSTAPIAPASNSATVVFIRDSGIGYAVNFSIIDHTGNLLGDAVAKSHFALQLQPGRYFFFARGGENTAAMQADVAAGRLYYVRVVPRFGVWLAGVELDPVKPSEPEWRSLPAWQAQSDRLAPIITKAAVTLSDSPLPDWASKAWKALTPVEQAGHMLLPDDGVGLAPSAPPVPSSTTTLATRAR